MKKSLCLLLVVILLVRTAPVVMAAGSAYVSGPEVVRAGDTITVSFSAGGGIIAGSGAISYDPSVLTLQGCRSINSDSWLVEFSGNKFVFFGRNMSSPSRNAIIFTATFSVAASVPVGSDISVSASNIILSNGQKDMPVGMVTYTATIAPALSDNCRLANLTADNGEITPGFSPDVLEYFATVPFEVSALGLSAAAEHSGAKVHIEHPVLAVGMATDVRITVTAENGASRTYVIHVSRLRDSNHVPGDNAKLRELSVEGYSLSPVFSADVTRYYVWLPYEAETAAVKAETENQRASLVISEPAELIPGQGNDISVTVTAENGAVQVYTVTVVRAPKHEDADDFLQREPKPTVPTVPETEPTGPKDDVHADAPLLSLPMLIAIFLGCILLGAFTGVAATLAANKKKE